MHLKRMIVILAAAASLSIAQAVPAYAASAAPGTHAPAAHALKIFNSGSPTFRGLSGWQEHRPVVGCPEW
jgi:hypothetical protein